MSKNKDNDFSNILIKKMYKKDLTQIISLNNLDYDVSARRKLIVFDETIKTSQKTALVVGGGCIDRCDASIENLAINFYFDILMPINEAIVKNLNCAIYVDTPIESCTNNYEKERWQEFIIRLEVFFTQLAKRIGIEIKIIRRDLSYKMIDKILENHNFSDNELKGLYDLVPSSKNIVFRPELLLHFRRSIISYLPEFISQYFEENFEEIIVCEELSQCKAIGKAWNINSNIYPKIYIDMPSLSCRNRMHRSNNGKIGIFEKNWKRAVDPLFQEFVNRIELEGVFKSLNVDNFWSAKDELEGIWYGKQ
ncbi:hypothetical protein [Facklamia miroungae]|uniref:Uncharacterized protein n=1 Tax=Facklamia miroungae TaxID=120956 RepID=A0A1G7TBK9_9LACT|nr:hypothetical protein [Facklamia miroungae]NKZ29753.1 hypothetical protein [Facklamia miroungae]SDG32688.1 hypothetical protein SAMN05421791_10583 [Facklamia miroungae]